MFDKVHYYIYYQRASGYIFYDRTMPGPDEADDRVNELKKRDYVVEAWHQITTHPKAFY